ncbi:MAG: EamA/RhaT family transporter [Bryobacterales bacterium]|nr:EamA/RhaT family transporter [Bryobacterales bacterium]
MKTGSLHHIGVLCGLAAGAWLGAAEAPTKLVSVGFSPFLISLGMVAGVFVARWTLPVLVKGIAYLAADIRNKPHLIVWAILAGAMWAVANTLTIFAIRDVGLSIAFPLWNTNSLVGLFWGWLLFGELRGAGSRQWLKVAGGTLAIVIGACLLAYSSSYQATNTRAQTLGMLAAFGASLLWGTMYVPYRKAYLSGMNPLSLVTVFTFGELTTVLLLTITLDGGVAHLVKGISDARAAFFWLFLGGLCWVIGDIFQQYATKYLGIGRGIPLSNTNQLWGLAWGVLVFGEASSRGGLLQFAIIAGSLLMIAGAAAISFAQPSVAEQFAWRRATGRECVRYGLDADSIAASLRGEDVLQQPAASARVWDFLVAAVAISIFVYLGTLARSQPIAMNPFWMSVLAAGSLGMLIAAGLHLWRRTRFV